jgi:hypothetical protein
MSEPLKNSAHPVEVAKARRRKMSSELLGTSEFQEMNGAMELNGYALKVDEAPLQEVSAPLLCYVRTKARMLAYVCADHGG